MDEIARWEEVDDPLALGGHHPGGVLHPEVPDQVSKRLKLKDKLFYQLVLQSKNM